MARASTALIGACGEYYVAAYLSRFHLIVALPRAGVPGCDLLATHEKGGKALRVQVKTGRYSKTKTRRWGEIYNWDTSFKVIENDGTDLWFVYVYLNDWLETDGDNERSNEQPKQPELLFIPSNVVVENLKQGQANGDTRPSFWIKVEDSRRYRGKDGVVLLLKALEQPVSG